MVHLLGLTKQFGTVMALDHVDLKVERGEFFALLGPSGSGKTTLLGLIAGFHEADGGKVMIEGADVTTIPSHKRKIAMVFQNYALFPHLKVFENVGFGLKMRGMDREEIRERVMKALSLVRLEGFEDRWPKQLSGGQQQRVALARALVVEPKVLLLDEPLAALDRGLRDEMRAELKEIQRSLGITTIFVTHDQSEAVSLSDRVAILDRGKIVQVDSPQGIYGRPKSSFVARFLGLHNVFSGRIIRREENFAWIEPDSGGHQWVSLLLTDRALGDCSFYVRPERIRIAKQLREGEPNHLSGVIKEITYQGVYHEIRVEVQSGIPLMIYEIDESRVASLQAGSKLNLYIDPKDIMII